MKSEPALILTFILFSLVSFGQEKLNQFDQNGKKDGKWIVYLTEKTWKEVTDSSKAGFCRFTYYEHGVNIYPMGDGGGKNWKCEAKSENIQHIGKMIVLDGEYKWIDKKGRVRFIHVLKNGEYVSYKEFYRSGKISKYFDYTNLYMGQIHTYSMLLYDKKGVITYFYMRSGEQGWHFYYYPKTLPNILSF